MSMDEYHARQLVNDAKNQGVRSSMDLARMQHSAREIQAHVQKAIALLGEETNPEAKAELERALTKLAALR